jgi:RHS repeat-associated protein
MAGISDKAVKIGYAENKYRFIGQLYDDDLDWDTYQMKYRTMDPQVGRFWQVDPLASKYVYNSTYAYAENRVVNGIDLEGREFWRMAAGILSGNPSQTNLGLTGMIANLQDDANGAMQSSSRLASGTSGQADSRLPGAVQNVINTADQANDAAASAQPALDVLQTTAAFASLTPIGEAGLPAAMGGSAASFSADAFSSRINLVDAFSLKASPDLLFRFDTRAPEEIQNASGFQSWGNNMNLSEHVDGSSLLNKTSGYVGTTTDPSVLSEWQEGYEQGYIYQIQRPANAIDVNAQYGSQYEFSWEKEVAVPNKISAKNIISYSPVGN